MPEEWCRLSINQRILVNKVLGCEICKIGLFYDKKYGAFACRERQSCVQLAIIQEF